MTGLPELPVASVGAVTEAPPRRADGCGHRCPACGAHWALSGMRAPHALIVLCRCCGWSALAALSDEQVALHA